MNWHHIPALKHSQPHARGQGLRKGQHVAVPRLARLPDDPPWCGDRVRLLFQGKMHDFVLAGSMAAALGVTRDSLLRLEARGVVPPAQFFVPGPWPGSKGRARCYPRRQVLRARQWLENAGLLGRRLSYHRDEVRAGLQRIADEEAAALRPSLHCQAG